MFLIYIRHLVFLQQPSEPEAFILRHAFKHPLTSALHTAADVNRQLQQRGVKHLIPLLCFHVGVLGARLSAGLLQQAVTTSADL